MSGWPGWEQDVLVGLGAPVNANTLALLGAWQACEGGTASFNPLNTTQPEPGATDYNPVGVKNYPSQAIGFRATLATLTNGHYDGIVAGLRSGSQTAAEILAANEGEFSTWGTSPSCITSIVGTAGGPKPPPPEQAQSLHGMWSTHTLTKRQGSAKLEAPEDLTSITRAWHRLTLAMGRTMPTQANRVKTARRAMARTLYLRTPRG